MITYEPLGEMEVESGCGTPVGLATRHVNFIGHERRGAIKFANGVDYHVKTIVFRVLYQYLHSEQHCRVRTKILETTSKSARVLRNVSTVDFPRPNQSTSRGKSYGTKTRWEESGHPCGRWL